MTKTVTISNPGTGDLAAAPISITGDDAGDFEFATAPSCDQVLPGEDCPVQIRFSPLTSEPGPRSASLVIANNTADHDPATVPLTGTATLAHATASPNPLDFGEVGLGTSDKVSETLEMLSDGTAPLMAMVGFEPDDPGPPGPPVPHSGPFAVDDGQCVDGGGGAVGPIPIGESCPLTVTFDPTGFEEGEYTRLLWILTAGTPVSIRLSAEVVSWEATLADSADLGSVKVGQSGEKTLELKSTGSGSLRLAGTSIEGADASSFDVDDDGCAAAVPPQGSCAITVRFTPASEGAKSATLKVSGNFGTKEVALTGTGLKADDPDNPTEPKARLKMRATTPRAVKPGRVFKIKVKVRNTGDAAARGVKLKAKVPARLARKPKVLKIKRIAPGKTVTRKIRIKVKRTAKKRRKLKVKVIASAAGVKKVAKKKSVRIRRR